MRSFLVKVRRVDPERRGGHRADDDGAGVELARDERLHDRPDRRPLHLEVPRRLLRVGR